MNRSLLEWKLAYDHRLEYGHELVAHSVIGRDGFPKWDFKCCEHTGSF